MTDENVLGLNIQMLFSYFAEILVQNSASQVIRLRSLIEQHCIQAHSSRPLLRIVGIE